MVMRIYEGDRQEARRENGMEETAKEEPTAELINAIAEALRDAYDCTRVWSAWSYGTMGPDDFVLVAEDNDRLLEIADAVIKVGTPADATLHALSDLLGVPQEGVVEAVRKLQAECDERREDCIHCIDDEDGDMAKTVAECEAAEKERNALKEKLERVNNAFGRLAPKGTWLCEVMENVYRAESIEAATKIAEEACPTIRELDLWTGPRAKAIGKEG